MEQGQHIKTICKLEASQGESLFNLLLLVSIVNGVYMGLIIRILFKVRLEASILPWPALWA